MQLIVTGNDSIQSAGDSTNSAELQLLFFRDGALYLQCYIDQTTLMVTLIWRSILDRNYVGWLSGRLASEAHALRLEWDAPFFGTHAFLEVTGWVGV